LCKRKLSDTLDFITDPNTSAAKDTFIGIPLEKRGDIIHREGDSVPRIDRLLHAIFIDERLKIALPLLFTTGANHGVIEKNQLQLKLSRFDDLRGAGKDLHPFFRRGETGRNEFRLSFLLDDAKPAGPERNESPVMTQRRDLNPCRLSGFENRPSPLDHYLGAINLQTNRCHFCDLSRPIGRME
jgi:hypothetical protein